VSDELLTAVDALTKPVINHVKQHDEDGKWLRTHTVALPPLLDQLTQAIHSSTSGKAGGGNPAGRAVLNSDALYQSMRITSTVTDWCNLARVRPTRNPTRDLRAWFVAWTQTPRDDSFHVTQLRKWEGVIRFLLDPPRRFELTDPCPECHAVSWVDDAGDSFPFPLTVEYRDEVSALDARVVCRGCERVWVGQFALRALRHDLEPVSTTEQEQRR